jgi:hypothetical protein
MEKGGPIEALADVIRGATGSVHEGD